MTQKPVQISAHFLLLFLGVSTAWADVKQQGRRELLPAPSAAPQCCSGTECCTACANEKATAIERRLRMLCSVDFKETPLEEVVERFREWSGLNIIVDEPALDDAGIRLDRPVTMKLDGVALKSALNLLLHQVHLTHVVKDEVVVLTTAAEARGNVISKVHPVGDLLWPADPLILPAGDGDIFVGWSSPTPTGLRLLEETPEESLIGLITHSIQPATWCENGGPGSIDYFPAGKSLVVSQTADVQEQVSDLLSALRRMVISEDSVGVLDPLLGLPPSRAAAWPLVTLTATQPEDYAPPPVLPFAMANHPVAPACAPFAAIGTPTFGPAPAVHAPPTPQAYVLKMEMIESHPDRKAGNCLGQELSSGSWIFGVSVNSDAGSSGRVDVKRPNQVVTGVQEMAFVPAPSFQGSMTEATANGDQKWLVQVKATALKNGRMHLMIVGVLGKAAKTNSGKVALDLMATPLVDRKLKLGKPAKVVLERDPTGKPCRWMRVTVKEMQPVAVPPEPCSAQPLSAPPWCAVPGGTLAFPAVVGFGPAPPRTPTATPQRDPR